LVIKYVAFYFIILFLTCTRVKERILWLHVCRIVKFPELNEGKHRKEESERETSNAFL
jgi:hypothetical protein